MNLSIINLEKIKEDSYRVFIETRTATEASLLDEFITEHKNSTKLFMQNIKIQYIEKILDIDNYTKIAITKNNYYLVRSKIHLIQYTIKTNLDFDRVLLLAQKLSDTRKILSTAIIKP